MKRYSINEIRNFIKCPQFGDSKYGRWGAYPLEVRETFKWLCDLHDSMDAIIESSFKHNEFLRKENELLKEELKELKDGIIGVYNNMNALEIINKHEMEDIEEI
jgi:DNA-binding transcriptional MerR regulator